MKIRRPGPSARTDRGRNSWKFLSWDTASRFFFLFRLFPLRKITNRKKRKNFRHAVSQECKFSGIFKNAGKTQCILGFIISIFKRVKFSFLKFKNARALNGPLLRHSYEIFANMVKSFRKDVKDIKNHIQNMQND